MKLDQLRYFVEAATFESVGQASRSVGVSPSAISHSISSLEDELGQKLFKREKKRIYLTTHGSVLMKRAQKILRDVDQLTEEMRSSDLPFSGKYRIATTRGLAKDFAACWARFHKKHAKISVEISTLRSAEIMAKTSVGELDLGVCFGPVRNSALDTREVRRDSYLIGVKKGHPLCSTRRNSLAAKLSEYPACMHAASSLAGTFEMPQVLSENGVHPTVDFIYDNYEVVLKRLENSNSWALLPGFIVARSKRIAGIEIKPWKAAISISAVWPKQAHPGPALSDFLAIFEEHVTTL